MESVNKLADRLQEVVLDGKWIANTNFRKTVADLTCKQADHKIRNLNTIADLIFHINYYMSGVLNVFRGGKLEIRDQYSFDTGPMVSEEDWNQLKNDLWSNTKELLMHIRKMEESKLDDVFVDEKYGTYRRNIEAMIEHCYYHLGQLSLLKKLILD